jgi:hypothetical protein
MVTYLSSGTLLLSGRRLFLGDTGGLCGLGLGSNDLLVSGGRRGLGLHGALDGGLGVDGCEHARLGVAGRRARSFACHFD